jgi:branched-chain amino acid transport system ATP-binding protein
VSTILRTRALGAGYDGVPVVSGLSIDVEEGGIATIIGANGAGKTTTLRALSGVLRPVSGEIIFAGESIAHMPPHEIVRRGLVMVPEGRRLFPTLTVLENLELGAFQPHSKRKRAETLRRVLAIFPRLAERRSQKAGTLSGGEQQMVAIGRALMSLPRLLMLDEPSLGLAPVIVQTLFTVVQELNALGITILLVEQNVKHCLSISSQAWVLAGGTVALSGTGPELLGDDNVRRAYLGM